MKPFVVEPMGTRVVFADGAFNRLRIEAERLGGSFLVVSTRGQSKLAEDAADRLAKGTSDIFAEAIMHVPVEIARRGVDIARAVRAEALVAVGGGSAIGLAKAIALKTGLPILAVPTTYSGSEMTPVWGLSEAGIKRTGRDERVRPTTVIYDPLLSVKLPTSTSVVSGFNAIAHCVEGLYSENVNPLASLMAEEGIRALAASLPRLRSDPCDLIARGEALYGAWLAGSVLGAVGMALHHKLCHTLGGLGLPHAETHAIVLPHALAYNAVAAPEAASRVAAALGGLDGPRGLYELSIKLGAPRALRDIGMPEKAIREAVSLVLAEPYYNPAALTESGLVNLLENCWAGRPPSYGTVQ